MRAIIICAALALGGCANKPPTSAIPKIEIPLPSSAMSPCPDLDQIASAQPQDLKLWIASSAKLYGMCAYEKKILIEYLIRNRPSI